ncbi:MAG: hypothetical protein PHV53_02670 [Fermentimonas sp.]|nr:hypothetical protein [Fermentimonas sp.]
MSLKRRLNVSDFRIRPEITRINEIKDPIEVKEVKPTITTINPAITTINEIQPHRVVINAKPGLNKADFRLKKRDLATNRIDLIRQRVELNFPIFDLFKGTPASQLNVPYTNNQQPSDTEIFSINDPANGKSFLPRYKIKSQKVSDKQQLMIKLNEAAEGEGGTLNIQLQSVVPPEIAATVAGMKPVKPNISFEIRYTLPNTGFKIVEPFTEIIETEDGYSISAHINSILKYNQLIAAMLDSIYGCQLVVKRELSFGIPFQNVPANNNLNINPQLYFTGKETSNINGNIFTRINLSVKNWKSFSNDLFIAAPSLPPCGLNSNASRTWVDIFDNKGKRLYGYCAFNSNENLKSFSFAVAANQNLPVNVYITLTDRAQNKVYTSNIINIQSTPTPIIESITEQLFTITTKEFTQEELFHLPELLYPYIYRNTTRTTVDVGGFVQHNIVFKRSEHIYLQDELNPTSFYFLPDSFVLGRGTYPPFYPSLKVKLDGETVEDLRASINYEAVAYTDAERIFDAFDELQKKTGLNKDDINFSPLSISGDKLNYKLSAPGEIGFKERKDSLVSLNRIIDTLPPISLPVFEDLFDNLTSPAATAMLQGHVEVTILGRAQPAIIPVNLKLTEVYSEILLIEQSKVPIIYIGIENNSGNTLQAQGLAAELQDGENILSCSKANLKLPLTLNPGEKTEFILIPKGPVQNPDSVKVILNWEGMQGTGTFHMQSQLYGTADFVQATNGLESTLQMDNVKGILSLPERDVPLNIKKINAPNSIASGEKYSFLAFLSEEVATYDPLDFIFQWEGLKIIPDKSKLFDIIVATSVGANYALTVKISLFIKFKTDTTSIRLMKVEFKNRQDGPLINTIMFTETDKSNEVLGIIEKEAVLMMPVKDYVLGDPNAGQYFYRITLIKETDTLGNTEITEGEWKAKSGSLEITTNQLPGSV